MNKVVENIGHAITIEDNKEKIIINPSKIEYVIWANNKLCAYMKSGNKICIDNKNRQVYNLFIREIQNSNNK